MGTENRIDQTTVANAEEDKRLASIAPGAGGWVPGQNTPLLASIGLGILGSMAPAALAIPALVIGTFALPVGPILAAILGGVAIGLAAHYGIKSAGPRS